MHHRMLLVAFFPTDPHCHSNKILNKKAITRSVYEISARFLRLQRNVRGWAIECCQSHFRPSTPVTTLTTKLAGALGGGSTLSLYLTLDLSSSRIQMAALGHALTLFCFVICQYLGLFPSQVHVLKVSLDDVHPILPWSSWFSLVTSQFLLCGLANCFGVVYF